MLWFLNPTAYDWTKLEIYGVYFDFVHTTFCPGILLDVCEEFTQT